MGQLLRLHPDTQVPADTLGSENTDCLVFVLFPSTEFWGIVGAETGPWNLCSQRHMRGADALGTCESTD